MNTPHDNHEEIRELLLPYSLGELDPVERARVEQAIAAEPALRRELNELEDVAARLVQSLPRVAAPAALRSRVLDAVHAGTDRRLAAESDPATAAAPGAATATSSATTVPDAPVSLDRARFRRDRASRPRFVLPAFAGALAVACIALALVAFDLRGELDSQRDKVAELQTTSQERDSAPVGFERASSHEMTTSGRFEQTKGSLVQVSDKHWILLLRDLPSPGVGNTWQIWTADSRGQIHNVGQWGTGEDTGVLLLKSGDVREVMVSFEQTTRPAPVPSGTPVADVKI
ncbi:MAG: anti-sigma factor [Thermoleophilia bacterium]|nr:anti-sigma factor [Thermoleophilia bacterium]